MDEAAALVSWGRQVLANRRLQRHRERLQNSRLCSPVLEMSAQPVDDPPTLPPSSPRASESNAADALRRRLSLARRRLVQLCSAADCAQRPEDPRAATSQRHAADDDSRNSPGASAQLDALRERESEAQIETQSEAQRERQLEAQRERQLEAQRERQLEAQREKQLEAQRERQLEAQREKQLETQRERQLEAQREKQLEAQRERQLEAQRERQLEAQGDRVPEAHLECADGAAVAAAAQCAAAVSAGDARLRSVLREASRVVRRGLVPALRSLCAALPGPGPHDESLASWLNTLDALPLGEVDVPAGAAAMARGAAAAAKVLSALRVRCDSVDARLFSLLDVARRQRSLQSTACDEAQRALAAVGAAADAAAAECSASDRRVAEALGRVEAARRSREARREELRDAATELEAVTARLSHLSGLVRDETARRDALRRAKVESQRVAALLCDAERELSALRIGARDAEAAAQCAALQAEASRVALQHYREAAAAKQTEAEQRTQRREALREELRAAAEAAEELQRRVAHATEERAALEFAVAQRQAELGVARDALEADRAELSAARREAAEAQRSAEAAAAKRCDAVMRLMGPAATGNKSLVGNKSLESQVGQVGERRKSLAEVLSSPPSDAGHPASVVGKTDHSSSGSGSKNDNCNSEDDSNKSKIKSKGAARQRRQCAEEKTPYAPRALEEVPLTPRGVMKEQSELRAAQALYCTARREACHAEPKSFCASGIAHMSTNAAGIGPSCGFTNGNKVQSAPIIVARPSKNDAWSCRVHSSLLMSSDL